MAGAPGIDVRLAAATQNDAALHSVRTIVRGPVSAHFMGEAEPQSPPNYGVRELVFTFEGDPRRYPFRPEGTLFFSDWSFDAIFSPGGSYLLLPQDHFGPYHVVRAENLKRYLAGEAAPDHVIDQPGAGGRPAAVLSDARWLSETALHYTASCCGETEDHVYHLAFPAFIGAPDSLPLSALRPGLDTEAPPDHLPDGLTDALARLDALDAVARKRPGAWTDGNIALGADQRQYDPSDEEIAAARYGDGLIAALAAMDPAARAAALAGPGLPDVLRYTRFDVREVKVMGSGLFHYASAPQVVAVVLGAAR